MPGSEEGHKTLGLLKCTLGKFEPAILPFLFSCYIRPHLEFSVQAWNPWLLRDQRALETAQRWATKMTRGMWNKPYNTRLSELGLFSMTYRRLRGDLILTYKILHTPNHPCKHLLLLATTNHLRGHTWKLMRPLNRLNCRSNFFPFRVTKIWNALLQSIVGSTTIEQFKLPWTAISSLFIM